MGKIIAFSGSHGTGKTDAAFSYLHKEIICKNREREQVISFEQIKEQARECPYPINFNSTNETNWWLFSEQIRKEIHYSTRCDVVVSDRCIVDYIAYAKFRKSIYTKGMFEIAKAHVHNYKKIFFHTIKNNDFWFDDGVRDVTDKQFREEIEKGLLYLFKELCFKDKDGIFEII